MSDAAKTAKEHAREIDIGLDVLLVALKVGTWLDPALAPAAPFISMILTHEANKLKSGLADGSIVPDGRGGLVPDTNSRVMPDGSLRPYNPAIDH